MRKILMIIQTCMFLANVVRGADLGIYSENGTVYEGGTYDRLLINNSSNVTVRQCSFSSSAAVDVVDIQSSVHIVLDSCEIDGQVDACTGINISQGCSHITIRGCHLHDFADDGIQIHSCRRISLVGNVIHSLYGCGTDGGCGPCYNGHSDGIELFSIDTCLIRGNLVYHIPSNAALFTSHWDPVNNKAFVIENNIFYVPQASITAYFQYLDGAKVFNNIIWNGSWHGLSIGQQVTDLEMKNNIVKSIDFTHLDGSFNSDEHDIDYNIIPGICGEYARNEHDIYDPLHSFTVIPSIYSHDVYNDVSREDFAPLSTSTAIDAGYAGPGVPETDIFGNPRVDIGAVDNTGGGTQDYYDRGPIEYGLSTGLIMGSEGRETGDMRIDMEPNPFRHVTVIRVASPGATQWTASIYTIKHDLVRTFDGAERMWNGTDGRGNPMENGHYIVKVKIGETYYSKMILLLR